MVMPPGELMECAKIAGMKRHTSFKALVEEGLCAVFARQKEDS